MDKGMKYIFLDEQNQEPEQSTWLPGEDIPLHIKDINNPVGIEIGTDGGTTTVHLLKQIPKLTLHGIDPYIPYIDWGGITFSWHDGKNSDSQDSYKSFMDKVAPFGERYIHHKKTSDEAVVDFADESMDFIFIDGLHTYEQVTKDCNNYYPKLKKGGLFCGHDFSAIKGVNQAINEFAQKIGLTHLNIMKQDVWYWHKS